MEIIESPPYNAKQKKPCNSAQAVNFFTKVYDGECGELPLGLNFLFFSTYNCVATNVDHITLADEQEHFLTSERTITIKGLHPLENTLHLATPGHPIITIRNLLLLLPTRTNHIPLFHGIDHQHNPNTPFILGKYPEHHSEELIQAIPNMDTALKIRIHQDDHSKVFLDINEGLTFGAQFQNYKNNKIRRIPLHVSSEESRNQLSNILQKINSSVTNRPTTKMLNTPIPHNKKSVWNNNLSFSTSTTSTTNTSSIASSKLDMAMLDTFDNSIMQQFNEQLVNLQTGHQSTNDRIDELDTTIKDRMNAIDDTIKSLVSTNQQNFSLLFAEFKLHPITANNNCEHIRIPTTEKDDMEIDTESHKRNNCTRSGSASKTSKK